MRKTIISPHADPAQTPWLDLEQIATVEVTSESDLFPIEHALGPKRTTGWRAQNLGPQIVRLRFDTPIELHLIHLRIVDQTAERTQELALFADIPGSGREEIVRQHFTFSPHGTTEEVEDYTVDLKNVEMLELRIDPDRAHDPAHSQHFAVLTELRLA
jgi:hypothetical protein